MQTAFRTKGRFRLLIQFVWAVTLVVFMFVSTGCSAWMVHPITHVQYDGDELLKKETRFHLKNGAVVAMHVTEIDYPFVRGKPVKPLAVGIRSPAYNDSTPQTVEVDCRDVYKLEIKQVKTGASVVVFVLTAVTVIVVLMAVTSDDKSSKPPPSSSSQSSCPVLYVVGEGGRRLVGEPYAGAAVKSIQREDMMPVPGLSTGQVSLLMTNEARETQYTDFAELVIADHERGSRAVATHDQKVILVGEAQPPQKAVDSDGSDVTAEVTATDDQLWLTDLSTHLGDDRPVLTEELVVSFPPPKPGERPVLEMNLSNTYWLDLIMNRFFALMGDSFDKGMEKAGRDDNGPRIKEWINREGINLKVEALGRDGWQQVGQVSSVGPLAMRDVAVPLPANLPLDDTSPITLRVSGGSGFWQIDQVGLSTLRQENPQISRVAPAAVTSEEGLDERDLVAQTDGKYQVLPMLGNSVSLDFELPPLVPGLTRSSFFHSDGYYVAHKPIQSERSLGTIRTILDEEGALARFSLDMFRKYHEIAMERPRRSASIGGDF